MFGWHPVPGLENVDGLVVRSRVQHDPVSITFNEVIHEVQGSHVVSINYCGPSEATVWAIAEIDPAPKAAAAVFAAADSADVDTEAAPATDGETTSAPVSGSDDFPPPLHLASLIYKDKQSRKWDLGELGFPTKKKREPYEFVLHESHDDCRGGREHTIKLSLRAKAKWPEAADSGKTELEFTVHCKPGK